MSELENQIVNNGAAAQAPEATETAMTADVDPKAEKFREIANKRVNELCHKISVLGNLANRGSYHYTDAQVETIFGAIEEQVCRAKEKFYAQPEVTTDFIHL